MSYAQFTEYINCCESISESAFAAMNAEGFVPSLRVFRALKVPSIQTCTATDFLESWWSRDDHGRYHGIGDAYFYIDAFPNGPERNPEDVLQRLQQHGRKVEAAGDRGQDVLSCDFLSLCYTDFVFPFRSFHSRNHIFLPQI